MRVDTKIKLGVMNQSWLQGDRMGVKVKEEPCHL